MENLTVISGSGEHFELLLPAPELIRQGAEDLWEALQGAPRERRAEIAQILSPFFPPRCRGPLQRLSEPDVLKLIAAFRALAGEAENAAAVIPSLLCSQPKVPEYHFVPDSSREKQVIVQEARPLFLSESTAYHSLTPDENGVSSSGGTAAELKFQEHSPQLLSRSFSLTQQLIPERSFAALPGDETFAPLRFSFPEPFSISRTPLCSFSLPPVKEERSILNAPFSDLLPEEEKKCFHAAVPVQRGDPPFQLAEPFRPLSFAAGEQTFSESVCLAEVQKYFSPRSSLFLPEGKENFFYSLPAEHHTREEKFIVSPAFLGDGEKESLKVETVFSELSGADESSLTLSALLPGLPENFSVREIYEGRRLLPVLQTDSKSTVLEKNSFLAALKDLFKIFKLFPGQKKLPGTGKGARYPEACCITAKAGSGLPELGAAAVSFSRGDSPQSSGKLLYGAHPGNLSVPLPPSPVQCPQAPGTPAAGDAPEHPGHRPGFEGKKYRFGGKESQLTYQEFSDEVIAAAYCYKWHLEYAASLPPELLRRCLAAAGVRPRAPEPELPTENITAEEIAAAVERGKEALRRAMEKNQ